MKEKALSPDRTPAWAGASPPGSAATGLNRAPQQVLRHRGGMLREVDEEALGPRDRRPTAVPTRRRDPGGRGPDSLQVAVISALGACAGLTVYGALYGGGVYVSRGAAGAVSRGIGGITWAAGVAAVLLGAPPALQAAVATGGHVAADLACAHTRSTIESTVHLTAAVAGAATAVVVSLGGRLACAAARTVAVAAPAMLARVRLSLRQLRNAGQDGQGDGGAWDGELGSCAAEEAGGHLVQWAGAEAELDPLWGFHTWPRPSAGPSAPSAPPPDDDEEVGAVPLHVPLPLTWGTACWLIVPEPCRRVRE
jgi:hypothetical protein